MSQKRPRGRPVGPSTLERRKVEELLRSSPAHITRMTKAERAEVEDGIAASERVRKQILKDYRHGATTPYAHAYKIASLGDESMEGYKADVLAYDHKYKKIAETARENSAEEKRKTADEQAALVCEHFRTLLSRAVPLGPLSRSEVAKRMKYRWPSNGQLGELPSERTLRNWIKRCSPFLDQRIGRTLSGKK